MQVKTPSYFEKQISQYKNDCDSDHKGEFWFSSDLRLLKHINPSKSKFKYNFYNEAKDTQQYLLALYWHSFKLTFLKLKSVIYSLMNLQIGQDPTGVAYVCPPWHLLKLDYPRLLLHSQSGFSAGMLDS